MLASRRALTLACMAAIVACSAGGSGGYIPPADAGTNLGVGARCSTDGQCRAGLVCKMGACAPSHAAPDGSPCTLSDECKDGSYCGPDRKCAPAGTGGDGDRCGSDADCKSGLRCDIESFKTICRPEGMVDVGGTCKSGSDCFAGLGCLDGKCAPLPPNPNGKPPLGFVTWKGETCVDDMGPIKAYFRVPRGSNDGDFYRLPFPNDIRKKSGHPDLGGHPTPGATVLGYDLVDRYLRDLEQNADGFSAWPTITLRFSGNVDFASLKANGVVRFLDLTSGIDLGYQWIASTARNQYVCDNWLALRSAVPLAPGHVHAMFITTAAKDTKQNPVARDADFSAVMSPSAPQDPALAAAYAAYKPLRDWAAAQKFDPNTILTAAVFTTNQPSRTPSKMAAAVAAAPAPVASSWVRCGDGPSPCPQAQGNRACGAPDPDFDELHALLTIPIFQKGNPPYLAPADGGDLDLDVDGTPKVTRTEQVCMALTVPKGTMPAAGWPLVIYAHGTGGSFRDHVVSGVAKRLATANDGMGSKAPMAVLGIDQVAHGTRRGSSSASPDDIFYNFGNPAAARGNPLQGAADQLSLARFAKSLLLPAQMSPTMADIKFSRVLFWGHSQGATEGSISIPYSKDVSALVLSGQGASHKDGLVTKSSPVNVAAVLPIVAQDFAMGGYHPVVAIMQNALDPADPIHHALPMVLAPPTGVMPKHLFQPFAQKDTYSPPFTEIAYAFAAGLGVAAPPPSVTMQDMTLAGQMQIKVPASANVNGYTAIIREYAPANDDGHFVAFQDVDAKADVDRFFFGAAQGQVPKVGK